MKHVGKAFPLLLAVLLGGCGGEDVPAGQNLAPDPPTDLTKVPTAAPPSTVPPVAPGTDRYELRLLGRNQGGATPVLFGLRSVEVTGSSAVPVQPISFIVDLGNTTHAWLLAYMDVPTGEENLSVRVVMDDFGAFHFGVTDVVDARPVELSAPIRKSKMVRGRAVLELDVTKSIAATPSGHVFTPNFRVVH